VIDLGDVLGDSNAVPYFLVTMAIAIWLIVLSEWRDHVDDEER